MSSSSLHILVIGGGIGGLCLAQRLKAAGVNVAVYERNPSTVWPEGTRISINPVGSRALHDCLPPVLWDSFVTLAARTPAGIGFLTEHLEELVVLGDAFMARGTEEPIDGHYPVSRIALRHLLLVGLSDIVHFDKTFERYEQTPDGKVTAFFTDGTSATGDVLVGADGANSRVRQQYLPHAPRVEIGAGGVGGRLPLTDQSRSWLPDALTTRLNLIMSPSSYTLFTGIYDRQQRSVEALKRIHERAKAAGLNPQLLIDTTESYLLWAFIAPASTFSAQEYQLKGQAVQSIVKQRIANWHPTLSRLVAESDPSDMGIMTFKASTLVAAWESSNVTLLGDAIHNMPPVGGLGGNMALRDASALARALIAVEHGTSSLLPAIQTYEAEMRAEGFAAVRAALRFTQLTITSSRLQRLAARTWFRLCHTLPPLKRALESAWTEPMRQKK